MSSSKARRRMICWPVFSRSCITGMCPKCQNGTKKTSAEIFDRMTAMKLTGVIDMERNQVVEAR